MLRFSNSGQPAARLNSLYVNLPPTGSANGLSFGDALMSLGESGRVEFLLADVPTSTTTIDSVIVDFARAQSTGGFVLDEIYLAPPPLPGDYNRDGFVNDLDYDEWSSQFAIDSVDGGLFESYRTADGNNDGRVDAADFTLWRNQKDVVTDPSATSVPEPLSLMLPGLCCAFLSAVWHRHGAPHHH